MSKEITPETPLYSLTVGQFTELYMRLQKKPEQTKAFPDVYGVDTLREITGYSKPTIYLKTSKNEIPHFKRDGKLFFRHSEIIRWMTEYRIETKAEFSRKMDQKLGERVKV
jgi:predicted DNA-binding transcriptional regulator AlpA